jgi:hypothetical protein
MKKTLAVIALVAFLGGMSAPIFANANSTLFSIEMADKDPKKAKKAETEKKSSDCATEKKSSDCTTDKKAADCTTDKKAADCKTEKKASDCA